MNARKKTVATVEDFAGLTFGGDNRPFEEVPTPAEWRARTEAHYTVIGLAFAALKRDAEGMRELVAEAGEDDVLELFRHVKEVGAYYRAVGSVLETAEMRLLAGLARFATARAA